MRVKNNTESFFDKAQVQLSLEEELTDSFRNLKAAQKLRAYYKLNNDADRILKRQEKVMKRAWWKACENYRLFKTMGESK